MRISPCTLMAPAENTAYVWMAAQVLNKRSPEGEQLTFSKADGQLVTRLCTHIGVFIDSSRGSEGRRGPLELSHSNSLLAPVPCFVASRKLFAVFPPMHACPHLCLCSSGVINLVDALRLIKREREESARLLKTETEVRHRLLEIESDNFDGGQPGSPQSGPDRMPTTTGAYTNN